MYNMPSELQTSKTFFLVSGIINILAFFGWGTSTIVGGAFSCGLGCIIGILPVINIIGCILDFIAYNKLNTLNRTGTYGTIQTAAVFQIVTIMTGNVVSFVFGIITLNSIGSDAIRNFLQERGIY
jgi:hypothetical protein